MRLHINPGDAVPIYRQIIRQVQDAIASGRLTCGRKLMSQRDLAKQLVISPLTVKKAYDELERSKLIETRRGRGTFVCFSQPPADPTASRSRLSEEARRLLSRAYLAGVPFKQVLRILADEEARLQSERESVNQDASRRTK